LNRKKLKKVKSFFQYGFMKTDYFIDYRANACHHDDKHTGEAAVAGISLNE
jgi:hypothetical protein